MVNVRKLEASDVATLRQIAKSYNFPFPDLSRYIIDAVIVDDDDRIISYGIVKPMAEAIMISDLEMPKIARAKAMQELFDIAFFGAAKANCSQIHVFTENTQLAGTLMKHFGFQYAEGIPLVRNL